MHNFSKDKLKKIFIDGIMFIIGSFFFAISVNIFTAPNNLAPGGFIGIATMLAYLLKLSNNYIGILNIIINIPVFIWAWKDSGLNFIAKSAIATILSAIMIPLTSFLPMYTSISNGGIVPDAEFNMILVAILGGVTGGFGIALIFMRGGTTGGVDIVASLVGKHARHVSIGKLLFVLDAAILVASAFIYKNLESPLYAAIVVFVTTKVIDAMLYGVDIGKGKMMFIISPKNKQISQKIMTDLSRGVTELKSRGSYTGKEGEVLLCAVRRYEVYKIYDLIHSIDERAFIVVGDAGEITGEGFRDSSENIK
ncbi:MAG: YitT family protein [Oscillospiraceae bacterium]|jgi:uncharacterized membrane-anchored protein YitT (DUF2179 family)|nr:YitT family protein [Oscillospiraceae bacterium]